MASKESGQWMIYGAYGYTARLVAEEASRRGMRPVLAGRNEARLKKMGQQLNLPYLPLALDNQERLQAALKDMQLVLNCAGPFWETATPLRDACLKAGTDYLDITGEMDILRDSYFSGDRAKESGSIVISGVGFDVVPTDTVAAILHKHLPDATDLKLAFAGEGGVSPGTAKTMLIMMPDRGAVRDSGTVKQVPLAALRREVPFSDEPRYGMSIPWGDIETAFYSTRIPSIAVMTAVPRGQALFMRAISLIAPLLGWKPLQGFLLNQIEKHVFGPEIDVRESGFMRVWGEVTNGQKTVSMTLDAPEGYQFTMLSCLHIVTKLLEGGVAPGAYTPTQALGVDYLLDIEGVSSSLR